jgi:hypothetical protein
MVPCAFSQPPTVPPPIVQITCESGYFNGPVKPYREAQAAVDVMGMVSSTGTPQTWSLELHNSFASIEDLQQALAKAMFNARAVGAVSGQSQDDLLAAPRTMIALYEHDWSYRPDEAVRLLPKARYIGVTIHRIRVGLEGEFGQLVRLRKLTADSINLNRPELAYRVVSGAPAGTYLLIAPLANLRAMDEGLNDVPAFAAPVADERAKAAPKAAEIEIGRENLLFSVVPNLSYVSDDFAAVDQAFWRQK